MKKMILASVLFASTTTTPLFRCACLAKTEHIKLDKQKINFLDLDVNLSRPLTIYLSGQADSQLRFVKRTVSLEEYRKHSGTWTMTISSDQTQCLKIVAQPIKVEQTKNGKVEFTWYLDPQKVGYALARTTYTSNSRAQPLVQEFLVTIA